MTQAPQGAPPGPGKAIIEPPKAMEFTSEPVAMRPPRSIFMAVEGFGKTTCGAYTKQPGFIMDPGETGLETLIGSQLVPNIPRVKPESWMDLMRFLDSLIEADEVPVKSLVLDAMGGIERLCHEHVCAKDFGGEWGEKGFASYQKGYDLSVNEWKRLLSKLDTIHARGVMIMFLSHCQVKNFRNPMGVDYDRFIADCHQKTWSVTHKWADVVLFGTFRAIVDKDSKNAKRGKGIGERIRTVYTERTDAFDAKNRYGMPPVIEIPEGRELMWETIRNAMMGGNSK